MTEVTSVGTLNVVFICLCYTIRTYRHEQQYIHYFPRGYSYSQCPIYYTCTQERLTYELEAWNN